MIIKKTFEQWLQQFNPKLRIMVHATNPDIDVLYYGNKRLCSIPKGLKNATFWTDTINDKRYDSGYQTSDGVAHRSLSGVGLVLLKHKLITPKQFVEHFITRRNKEFLARLQSRGAVPVKFD